MHNVWRWGRVSQQSYMFFMAHPDGNIETLISVICLRGKSVRYRASCNCDISEQWAILNLFLALSNKR